MFFSGGEISTRVQVVGTVDVRELSQHEMARAERELWVHYHHQKVNKDKDRLFAAFSGTRIIGVARCTRHHDGLEVDEVYVLDEFRHRGFARSIMQLLIIECGRNETLYTHSRTELVEFYSGLGFYPISETELPKSIWDQFSSTPVKRTEMCPMKRDPFPVSYGNDSKRT
jgi:N-acetylglutamate synthase-like GNAT family acetyltransferase